MKGWAFTRRAVAVSAALAAMLACSVAVSGPTGASGAPALVLATGRVTDDAGAPLAAVPVLVYAWPDGSALSRLKPGERVPWRLVGSGVTDAGGRYAIGADSVAALRRDAAPGGTLNLEVVAVGAGSLGLFAFPRRVVPAPGGAVRLVGTEPSGVGSSVAPARADLRIRSANGPSASEGTSQPALCLAPQFVKSYGPQWALVGQTYVTTSSVTQGFTYAAGQSSSLGVGVSPDAAAGTFTQGGTMSQSSTLTETFPTYGAHTNVYYFSEFVYGLFKIVCVPGRIAPHYAVHYQTQVTSYAGGTMVRFPRAAPRATDCVPQIRGSIAHSNNSAAITWSDGLTIPVIGVSLSTQTGYDQSAEVTYHYSAAHQLCGTGGEPGGTPYQLVAAP